LRIIVEQFAIDPGKRGCVRHFYDDPDFRHTADDQQRKLSWSAVGRGAIGCHR
jgi:hypothetical protein